MFQTADTDVASVAEQATNNAGIVTVIDMKAARSAVSAGFTSRGVRPAYSTAAALLRKHARIRSYRDAIVLLELVIRRAVLVIVAPALLIRRSFLFVRQAPRLVASKTTVFAGASQPIKTLASRAKFGARFKDFARTTGFESGRVHTPGLSFNELSLPCDRAWFTVGVAAVSFRSVLVELAERFRFAAGFAGLHGRLLLSGKDLSRFVLP